MKTYLTSHFGCLNILQNNNNPHQSNHCSNTATDLTDTSSCYWRCYGRSGRVASRCRRAGLVGSQGRGSGAVTGARIGNGNRVRDRRWVSSAAGADRRAHRSPYRVAWRSSARRGAGGNRAGGVTSGRATSGKGRSRVTDRNDAARVPSNCRRRSNRRASRVSGNVRRVRDSRDLRRGDESRRAIARNHCSDMLGDSLNAVAPSGGWNRRSSDRSNRGTRANSRKRSCVGESRTCLVASWAVGNIDSACSDGEGLSADNGRSHISIVAAGRRCSSCSSGRGGWPAGRRDTTGVARAAG